METLTIKKDLAFVKLTQMQKDAFPELLGTQDNEDLEKTIFKMSDMFHRLKLLGENDFFTQIQRVSRALNLAVKAGFEIDQALEIQDLFSCMALVIDGNFDLVNKQDDNFAKLLDRL